MKRKDGIYLRGRIFWIGYSGPRADGTRGEIRESSKSEDREVAEKLLDRRKRELANDAEGIRRFVGPGRERVRVGTLLDGLIAHFKTKRLKSLRQTETHKLPVQEFFGKLRASQVNRARIDAYIAHRREQEVADSTIDRELEILRRAFSLGVERGEVAYPLKVPKLVPTGQNARQGFFERSEFEALIAELPSELLRDVCRFGYMTGMRRGEILSLTWAGYDRETRTLRLHARDAKTGRGRMIPLAGWPELAEVIERRLAARRLDSDLIFHSNGHRVGDFYTTWMRACDRAGISGRTFHDFRRTAVRNMIRAGISQTVAKKISGHSTDSIFARYAIVSESDLIEAMERRAAYEATLPKASARSKRAKLVAISDKSRTK